MKNIRKIAAVMLFCSIWFTMAPTMLLAEETEGFLSDHQKLAVVSPRLTYIDLAEADLMINNGVATVDCWVKGDVLNATKAKVIAELQLKSGNSWMAYGTWTDTQNDYEAFVYKTKSVTKGNTYRVKATVTVWEGSQSEQLILFTDEVTA